MVPFSSAEIERERIEAAHARGIRFDGLSRHFAGPPTAFGVAIGYAGCSREALRDSLPELVGLLCPS